MNLNEIWIQLVHCIAGSSSTERYLYLIYGAYLFWLLATVLVMFLAKVAHISVTAVIIVSLALALQCNTLQNIDNKGTITQNWLPDMQSVSVMTFNLRGAGLDIDQNSWENRRSSIAALLRKSAPAIVGTQEGNAAMLSYLSLASGYYVVTGNNRTQSPDFTYSTLYDPKQVELISASLLSLSLSEQTLHPKHCTISLFRKAGTNSTIDDEAYYVLHFNTHLDFVDERVRVKQAIVLRQHIADTVRRFHHDHSSIPDSKVAVVITGDFNSLRYSSTWYTLIHGKSRAAMDTDDGTFPVALQDTYLSAAGPSGYGASDRTYFSFHGFLGKRMETLFMAVPIAATCTVISLFPLSSSSTLCVPFSLDFHVDWVLIGTLNSTHHLEKLDCQWPTIMSHSTIQTSVQSYSPALLSTSAHDNELRYLSDHYPVIVEMVFADVSNVCGSSPCNDPNSSP